MFDARADDAGIASITTLSVLSMWRCILVAFPFKKYALGQRQAAYLIVFIWIYSLITTVPPLLGWGRYGPEAAHIR